MNRMLKSKTFWAGIAAALTAGAQYATGEATAAEAARLAIEGAMVVFLRMGVGKVEAKLEKSF